ncbi:unnamed protein product [Rotaria magnacalcarata]|uniref:NAD(P)(+)--arginine ADP-ribosyltransferase n=2 Tax=Rotaria magnacalcarata TaxID=392030 RepID=A0A816NIR8_9BILA|nr:unnamed protein product [Rotaria magnacalcarata]
MNLETSMESLSEELLQAQNTRPRHRPFQDYLIIWLDLNLDRTSTYYESRLAQIQVVCSDMYIFTERDECVDFLTDADNKKTFLILEDYVGKEIIPLIHDIPYIDSIYILCIHEDQLENWTNMWNKVKSIEVEIIAIDQLLQQIIKQINQNSISMSFLHMNEDRSTTNLNELPPSFMYTQIFKEILLKMNRAELDRKDFIQLWRNTYSDNIEKLKTIDEFERDYCSQSAISWYTRERFIFENGNASLRSLDSRLIKNMGFFIRDLHDQIEELYKQQSANNQMISYVFYRGQGLSTADFQKLQKTKGGLMSFNNFLSVSVDFAVANAFAESSSDTSNTVGILFEISMNSASSSVPFVRVTQLSRFIEEEEVLFTMHTVFRIRDIQQISNNNRLWKVQLIATDENDSQLRTLTECIRQEIDGDAWYRMGKLMQYVGHFEEAQELYNDLLTTGSSDAHKGFIYRHLGQAAFGQGNYKLATTFFESAIEIESKNLHEDNVSLAHAYNGLAIVQNRTGDYSQALEYYEKSLQIWKKVLPPNHPNLGASYNSMGHTYTAKGDYSKALQYYEKSHEIIEKAFPLNHPYIAFSYNSMGQFYLHMGDYEKAVQYYEKSLRIREKVLPLNHPDVATSYSAIGEVCKHTGHYLKAIECYEKSIQITEALFPKHPQLATFYNSIALMCSKMGNCSKALKYVEKSFQILQKILSQDHPDLAISYNSTTPVSNNKDACSTLEYSEKVSK